MFAPSKAKPRVVVACLGAALVLSVCVSALVSALFVLVLLADPAPGHAAPSGAYTLLFGGLAVLCWIGTVRLERWVGGQREKATPDPPADLEGVWPPPPRLPPTPEDDVTSPP